jgi:hypothetical protein
MTDINETLKQRGQRYGTFVENAATAQNLKNVLRSSDNWTWLDYDMQQALDVICDKASRILSGDPTYADNWHDIAGYAKLVEDRLTAPVATAGVATEPEYVPDSAPLEQAALSQDDDPDWGAWRAWPLVGHGFVVRRHDAKKNYQTFNEGAGYRSFRFANSARDKAKELNEANKS